MGTPDPDYGGVGIGPGARLGVGRKLHKKNHNLGSIFDPLAPQQPASQLVQ